MLIHLIRHTTPDIDTGICYGQADLDVVNSFTQEKDIVLSKTLDKYDAVFYSPLQRCAKLAEFIKADHREVNHDIMEYNFGDWELQSWDELYQRQEAKAWFKDVVYNPAPNGESLQQMQIRVQRFIDKLHQLDYDNVAVVTHSGVQRIFNSWVMDIPLKNIFKLQLEFGAVLEVELDKSGKRTVIKHL